LRREVAEGFLGGDAGEGGDEEDGGRGREGGGKQVAEKLAALALRAAEEGRDIKDPEAGV
jgi:hypothetical protein